jgi:FixJ family two-component response regulator
MSGYAEPGEMPAGVPFLSKPFSPSKLIATVERALAASAEVQQDLRRACAEAERLQLEGEHLRGELREAIREARETVRRSRDRREGSHK